MFLNKNIITPFTLPFTSSYSSHVTLLVSNVSPTGEIIYIICILFIIYSKTLLVLVRLNQMDFKFWNYSLGKSISPVFIIPQLSVVFFLTLGSCEIFPFHVSIATGIFPVSVLFKQPYFWNFIVVVFLTFLGNIISQMASCSFGS